jgi:FtsP/CotA-like multicopper oxidase with cupredoxin domain
MSCKLQNRILAIFTVQLLILALAVGPSYAADYYLRAEQTTKTMPDGEIITMWGFAPDVDNTFSALTTASIPGPMLSVDTDDPNITIHLKNNLSEPVSVVVPGLVAAMTPVFFTDLDGRSRVRSFTHETLPNAIGKYTWSSLKDGTFIYQSGTHPAVQIQMGLYGGLKLEADPCVPYVGVPVDSEADIFFSEIDPALHQAVADGTYGSPALIDPVLLEENFDTDAGVFTYADDAFRGTSQPGYADGMYDVSRGFATGALIIQLGGIDTVDVLGMSGGYSATFNVPVSVNVTVSLRYKITQTPNYEADEYSEALVAVDGTLHGRASTDYLDRVSGDGEGGAVETTGWKQFTVDLGTMSAGTHTLTVGGFNNKKTSSVESTEIFIDEIRISRDTTPPVITMTSTIDYDPKYFLINGQPHPESSVYILAGASAETTLLRFYNAGLKSHFPTIQGLYMNIIAENGFPYQYPKNQYSLSLPAGKTRDATISPAQDAFYPIYDRALNLTNNAATNGGMLAFLNVGNLNIPPVISNVTATPSAIIDGATSQLLVTASDPEGSPLTYSWSVPVGDGSFDSDAISNPVYAAPGDIVGTEVITLSITVSDGVDTADSSVGVTVQGIFLSESFAADAGSFTPLDNAFRSTTQGAYASETYDSAGGFTDGGLTVDLGGIDTADVIGMSGGWISTFNLIADSTVNVSFRFNLTQSPNYESMEFSQALLAVDGALIGTGGNDYLAILSGDGEGGPIETTGWQQVNVNLGILTAGNHTITIGAYNNQKTSATETTEILIDDVLIGP